MENSIFYLTGLALILLTILTWGIFFWGFHKILPKTSLSKKLQERLPRLVPLLWVCWLILICFLASQGLYDFGDGTALKPQILISVFIPVLVVFFLSIFSQKLQQILHYTPQTWLIGLQHFRLYVEFILWALFSQNLIPIQMSFEGRNFDILVGIFAPLVALLYRFKPSKKLVIIWNIFGLLLLLNIVITSILSMPTPLRYFMNEPANRIMGTFPFILVPVGMVTLAFTLHILSLNKTLRD